MDPILDGYVRDFISQHGLQPKNSGEAFEHFANHCVVARDFPSLSDTTNIVIGGSEDTGIDGLAIFINGIHAEDESTVDYFAEKTRIEVDFVFIQSKSGRKISAAEIGSFGEGVYSFFDNTGMKENSDIKTARRLKDYIFKNSVKLSRRPNIFLYYCTATNYRGDQNIDSRANSVVSRLNKLDLFSDVDFRFLNREKLTTRYDEIRLKIEKEINFERHAVFPEVSGVRQAYIGLMQSTEMLKLITNSDGELQRNLFSENIRDFLGENKVNLEIEATLRNDENRRLLPVLNNGVTIVAREINNVGDKFTLRDYQIVNGCQTSNVLYNNRKYINDSVFLPVKILEVSNSELVNDIVKSTNRQTQVTDEAFVALEDFHKQLEKFFNNMKSHSGDILLYERRRNQYQDNEVSQRNVITLTLLTKSFISCFLGDPHSTTRYYGELIESNKSRIFLDGHSLWGYYTSSALFHNVDEYFRGITPKWLRHYRYQACYLYIRYFGDPPDLFKQKDMDRFCNKILRSLEDKSAFEATLEKSIAIIKDSLGQEGTSYSRNPPHRRREFTKKIQELLEARR